MPITFRRLQVFVTTAQDGNFRRAADRLGISQPSVSAQVRAIETHLGQPLFERKRGASCKLTLQGKEFLVRARELVEAERGLSDANGAEHATVLRVTVGPVLLENRVKPMLPEFYEKHPNVALEFVPFNPAIVGEQAVRSGAVDALLYTGGPPQRICPKTQIISRVSCSIYGSAALVSQLSGDTDELATVPFIIPPKNYHISQWFESELTRVGITPQNIIARPPYIDVVLKMVIASKGLAVLFDEHAAKHVETGEIKAVGPRSMSAMRVMVLGKRALRPEMAPALQFLKQVATVENAASSYKHGFTLALNSAA
jgi:DNA-binding transcriptional LysR family regulator